MSYPNINRVVVSGNLATDAELRSFPSGACLATFRIAVNGRNRKANFFGVDLWGPRAEKLVEYLTKGRPVAIDGRLESKEWEAGDGSKRYETRIVVDEIELVGKRSDEPAKKPAQKRRPSGTRATKGTPAKGTSKRATRTSTRSKS